MGESSRGTGFVYFAVLLLVKFLTCKSEEDAFGWDSNPEDVIKPHTDRCNIEAHDANELTTAEFLKRYAYSEPVIIRNVDNNEFRRLTAKDVMLSAWKDEKVTLNSANTYSYTRFETTFGDYIEKRLKPQDMEILGNETLYLFGDIDQHVWAPLLDKYKRPPWTLPGHSPALSFGIANAGTGVPFHFHGPGFAEVIHGKKRWFLSPFEQRPKFNPDKTTLEWYLKDYSKIPRDELLYECAIKPGEVIYFPDKWWHATLNEELSVFMSTFLSP